MKKTIVYLCAIIFVFSFTSCGKDGDLGPEGKQGIEGTKGDRGELGAKGDRGDDGKEGPKGDRGERGEAGPRGERGESGKDGAANVFSSDWIDYDWTAMYPGGRYAEFSFGLDDVVAPIMKDGGFILIYGRGETVFSDGSYDEYQIPKTFYNGASSATEFVVGYDMRHSSKTTLFVHARLIRPQGEFDQWHKGNLNQIRYVVVPKGVKLSATNPNPTAADWKKLSYDQAKKILNLKD